MHDLAEWRASVDISRQLQLAGGAIPLSETHHILGNAMVMPSVAVVDLRITGLGARRKLSR
jgi:hypothetical protein